MLCRPRSPTKNRLMPEESQQSIAERHQRIIQLYQQGRYEDAIEIARSAREWLAHTSTEPTDLTDTLTFLALLYGAKGDYSIAQSLYQQVMEQLDIAPADDSDLTDDITRLAFLYASEDSDELAQLLGQQALEIRRKERGDDHLDVADSLTHLALVYTTIGDCTTAEELYRQAQEIYSNSLGSQHPYVITCLNNRVQMYEALGQLTEAAGCLEQVLEVERATLGENHPEVATSSNNLAGLYRELGNSQKALPYQQQALEIERQTSGENHSDYATCLNNLGMLYRELGNHREAETLLQKALEIERRNRGNNHPDLIPLLDNLVDVRAVLGKYAESEPLLLQVLEIERQTLGEKHPDYANSLNNLAGLYRNLGRYDPARSLYQQVLQIREQTVGKNHPDYAVGLHDLAVLYQQIGHYQEAKQLYQQSLQIREQTVGENHPDTATCLSSLAVLYRELGNYEKAGQLHQQVLKIERQAGRTQDSEHAVSLSNLAGVYQATGNYAEAEPLYQQALDVLRQLQMEQHPEFANILNNLVSFYNDLGNYAEAIKLLQQTLEIRLQTLGQNHPDYATSLQNLAAFYITGGKYTEATQVLNQVLEIRSQSLGQEHPNYASSLNNLAFLYDRVGKYTEAETLLKQALTITLTVFGERHPDSAMALGNLATHYLMVGNYTEAEALLDEALKIQRDSVGESHPQYAVTLGNLAELCASTNRYAEALEWSQQVEAINDQMLGEVFSIGSERRRMAYLARLQTQFEAFVSLIVRCLAHSPTVVQTGLELVLRRKGIGAEALAAQRDAVLGGRYPKLRSKLEELTTLRRQIAQKTLAGPSSPEGLQEHQHLLAEWNAQKEQLEIQLARQIPEMKLQQKLQETNWRKIAENLPKPAVLIEFVRSRFYDFEAAIAQMESKWKPTHYFVFILSANQPEKVQILDLGEATLIDRMIASFRASITGEGSRREFETVPTEFISGEIANKGLALRQAIFDPLLTAIGNCKRLFLAPDGDLTRLPFEVLPLDRNRRLIDEYGISYLSTGRDVMRFGVTSSQNPSESLVFANPDFDLSADASTESFETGKSFRRHSRDLNRTQPDFCHLPGTQIEGEQIAALLGVRPLLGQQALETRLQACRSPQILHLATHGFFLENHKRTPDREGLGKIGRLSGYEENPLLRSGLALAGANTWLKGGSLPPEAEDGLLTAEDVSGLDLLDTELVVLSACETGLGEIRTGEGVFGLRRAFVVAGAKTLVMSLWKVPDRQTQELMVEFYHRILNGQPCADALRAAQLEMKQKYPNPLYWGAFICQGNPNSCPSVKAHQKTI